MSHSIIGKIIACIILVLLCFVIGAQAAEGAKGSLVILVAIVGVFFMLVMGSRSWMLLFLIPPIMQLLPLPGNKTFLISGVVLVYWVILWAMGYVRIRWRSLWFLDILFLLSVALMVAAFIRRPVTVVFLGLEMDNIGGAVYAVVAGAVVHYVTLSIIPVSYAQMQKVLNWKLWLGLFCCIVGLVMGLVGFSSVNDSMGLEEAMTSSRFANFMPLGVYMSNMIYACFSLSRIVINPVLLGGVLVGFVFIAWSGFRSALVSQAMVLSFMAIVKKELCMVLTFGVLAYGGLLMMSAVGTVRTLPFGIQRSLGSLPGVTVTEEARRSGKDSTDWRVVMWKWAMDPRTKYIKNYIWGDGFGMSFSAIRRNSRAIMRGEARHGDQDFYATAGEWHSGWITAIHRLGVVGLVLITITYIYSFILMFRVCSSYRGSPMFPLAVINLMPFSVKSIAFYLSAGSVDTYFSTFTTIALAKLLFCIAREEGLVVPLLQHRRYVPLMIEEHGDKLRQPS